MNFVQISTPYGHDACSLAVDKTYENDSRPVDEDTSFLISFPRSENTVMTVSKLLFLRYLVFIGCGKDVGEYFISHTSYPQPMNMHYANDTIT